MTLQILNKYFLIINLLSFCLFTIDFVRFIQSGNGLKLHWVCDLVTVLGGSIGALAAFILWDRKIVKSNITWRVFAFCMLIIHIVTYLFILHLLNDEIKLAEITSIVAIIDAFLKKNKVLWYYLLTLNIITFVAFVADKIRAIEGRWRIRELLLLGLSLIGGSIGGWIAMYTIRHKIHSPQFSFGVPFILFTQLIVMVYWFISQVFVK